MLVGWNGRLLVLVLAVGAVPVCSRAADVQRIDMRFATDGAAEAPDFRQHVVPLIGRLGCNGRACHGSFQGQGGLRLSLFGYDFKADHDNLLAGDEPRTNLAEPAASLILRKPLEEEPHEGGRRLTRDTWQYRVLRAWIEAGAKESGADAATFVRLEVTPAEIVAASRGDTWQLKAVAVWSDGVREDVTPLCRFQTNDDQVAAIDEFGTVTAVGPGDSHVVAFYDNGVVPVPVLFPVSGLTGDAYPEVPTSTAIDELVVRKLRKLGEVPSDRCTDAEFLRRVSLDMTGTLPTAQESAAFLADARPDKRARKVDELLERPGYAAWWATKFCDWTGNNAQRNQNNGPDRRQVASAAWYEWVRSRIAANTPYDELVEGIVLARSRLEDESYEDYCRRMSEYQRKGSEASFASQPYLPYYWSRDNFRTPEERALGFAYTFLGVRIQCAQCHKHPFDQWTKDDFDRFENFFTRVRYGQAPETKSDADEMIAALGIAKSRKGGDLYKELTTLVIDGEVVPYQETYVVPPPKPLSPQAMARLGGAKGAKAKNRSQLLGGRTATVLGGREFKIDELADPREVLMDWMRDESNPYFARAIVNRIWAGYFNVGIVEPPDDQSLANPPSNEPLLDYLAYGFRSHGYDLKWVHREIALSDTYQRSWRPTETNRLDERNFARSVPRRVPAEAIYDALKIATASDSEAARLTTSMKGRAIAEPVVAARGGGYALGVFGRSIRESNCDCDRSMEPGLLQSVFLQNDQEMLALIDRNGGWVSQVAARTSPSERDVTTGRQRAWELKVDQLQAELAEAKEEGDQGRIAAVERRLAFLHKKLDELAPAVAALPQERFRATAAEREAFAPLVDQAYLRTVGRRPTDGEVARAMKYLRETGDLKLATRDLLWALLNTKEFFVNH